ncbi:POTE ankyrin domain family member B-like [Macaca fascicularis]|uniref:POTE ankyrin domain family member B-like n=1 Tax=Macaca fascicularis TaxID=9541 RepID=UPI003D157A9E
MVAEVSSIPAASAVKKPFGLRSKMGKWCHHCFPCCRASGKSNVGASGDHHASAVKTRRSKMAKWCCHCFPRCKGRGESNVEAWEDYDDSAFMEPRYHVRGEDLDKLHRAAWWGKVPRKDLIVMLRDTDVNKTDKEKRTALHLASANGNSEIVKLLLDRRCQLDILDNKKRTALIKAVQCQEDECALMLLEHGTDPNIPDEYGNTALHYAIYNEDKLMAKALLLYGADIESKNKHGLTPLLLGVHGQKQQVVKFLIKKKANLSARDRCGRNALILAVRCGSASIVSLLLEQNIDVSSKDLSGQMARDYAVSSHHNVICQLLSDYKEKQMLKISSENSNPEQDLKLTSEEESQRLKGSENSQPEEMSQEPEINRDCDKEAEEEMKKHGSNNMGLPENLTNDATAGNGDDGLIPQSKSRTPESQQFPDTENEEYHSDEQNDTQKQVSEEQNAGISQEEILTGKQEQMEVAEKKMNSEVSLTNKKEKDLLHENRMLQEEIVMLRLEVDKIKEQSQLREKKLLEEIESNNDKLLKAVKLNKEALAKISISCVGFGDYKPIKGRRDPVARHSCFTKSWPDCFCKQALIPFLITGQDLPPEASSYPHQCSLANGDLKPSWDRVPRERGGLPPLLFGPSWQGLQPAPHWNYQACSNLAIPWTELPGATEILSAAASAVELPLLLSEYQGSKDPKCHIDTSNKLQLTQGTHQSTSHSTSTWECSTHPNPHQLPLKTKPWLEQSQNPHPCQHFTIEVMLCREKGTFLYPERPLLLWGRGGSEKAPRGALASSPPQTSTASSVTAHRVSRGPLAHTPAVLPPPPVNARRETGTLASASIPPQLPHLDPLSAVDSKPQGAREQRWGPIHVPQS